MVGCSTCILHVLLLLSGIAFKVAPACDDDDVVDDDDPVDDDDFGYNDDAGDRDDGIILLHNTPIVVVKTRFKRTSNSILCLNDCAKLYWYAVERKCGEKCDACIVSLIFSADDGDAAAAADVHNDNDDAADDDDAAADDNCDDDAADNVVLMPIVPRLLHTYLPDGLDIFPSYKIMLMMMMLMVVSSDRRPLRHGGTVRYYAFFCYYTSSTAGPLWNFHQSQHHWATRKNLEKKKNSFSYLTTPLYTENMSERTPVPWTC